MTIDEIYTQLRTRGRSIDNDHATCDACRDWFHVDELIPVAGTETGLPEDLGLCFACHQELPPRTLTVAVVRSGGLPVAFARSVAASAVTARWSDVDLDEVYAPTYEARLDAWVIRYRFERSEGLGRRIPMRLEIDENGHDLGDDRWRQDEEASA